MLVIVASVGYSVIAKKVHRSRVIRIGKHELLAALLQKQTILTDYVYQETPI